MLFGSGGQLSSPNYPLYLLPEIQCTWTIKVKVHLFIVINFIDVHLSLTENCESSFLAVFNGFASPFETPDDVICKIKGGREFKSKGFRIALRLKSGATNDQNLRGFLISWTAVTSPLIEGTCPGFHCKGGEYCIDTSKLLCNPLHRYCIDASLRCNSVPNCGAFDSSDEEGCFTLNAIIVVCLVSLVLTLAFILFAILYWCRMRRRQRKKMILLQMQRHKRSGNRNSITRQSFDQNNQTPVIDINKITYDVEYKLKTTQDDNFLSDAMQFQKPTNVMTNSLKNRLKSIRGSLDKRSPCHDQYKYIIIQPNSGVNLSPCRPVLSKFCNGVLYSEVPYGGSNLSDNNSESTTILKFSENNENKPKNKISKNRINNNYDNEDNNKIDNNDHSYFHRDEKDTFSDVTIQKKTINKIKTHNLASKNDKFTNKLTNKIDKTNNYPKTDFENLQNKTGNLIPNKENIISDYNGITEKFIKNRKKHPRAEDSFENINNNNNSKNVNDISSKFRENKPDDDDSDLLIKNIDKKSFKNDKFSGNTVDMIHLQKTSISKNLQTTNEIMSPAKTEQHTAQMNTHKHQQHQHQQQHSRQKERQQQYQHQKHRQTSKSMCYQSPSLLYDPRCNLDGYECFHHFCDYCHYSSLHHHLHRLPHPHIIPFPQHYHSQNKKGISHHNRRLSEKNLFKCNYSEICLECYGAKDRNITMHSTSHKEIYKSNSSFENEEDTPEKPTLTNAVSGSSLKKRSNSMRNHSKRRDVTSAGPHRNRILSASTTTINNNNNDDDNNDDDYNDDDNYELSNGLT